MNVPPGTFWPTHQLHAKPLTHRQFVEAVLKRIIVFPQLFNIVERYAERFLVRLADIVHPLLDVPGVGRLLSVLSASNYSPRLHLGTRYTPSKYRHSRGPLRSLSVRTRKLF